MPRSSLTHLDKAVGAKIREYRIALGMTQVQIAEKVGHSYQNQHKVEQGYHRVSVGKLCQYAEALGVSVVDLLPSELNKGATVSGNRAKIAIEFARLLPRMRSDRVRQALLLIAKELVREEEP